MSDSNTLYWLVATRLPEIGPITFHAWLALFGDIHVLFTATQSELANAGLSAKQIYALQNPDWEAAKKDLTWCEKNACTIITCVDPAYPRLLREIPDAPLVLYVRGDITLLNQPQLAIVGSRNPTPSGRELAYHFASTLVKAGLHITSGLALGIDAASHRGALDSGGKTLAVFGTGLHYIYPHNHRKLAEDITSNGLLVSEFSPYEPPQANHFPRRNRTISGLSLGVLVVEAALRSGSLITARYANEQGREIFAIPGSIHNPLAHGCHHLIRQGAKLVETATDILEELGTLHSALTSTKTPLKSIADPKKHDTLASPVRALLAQVGYEATSLDAIILRSGLTASEVSSMLLSLELQGFLKTVRGGYQRI
ncbi:MAG: protecting protein DprA [Gammaproteobacteria bacterium]|nr:protecting protein DprA [Gammaproteobacteria bacterium]